MTTIDRAMKRTFDLSLAIVGISIVWPFIAIFWLLAKNSTGASGFFVQERIGRNGEPFPLLKIRTMLPIAGSTVTIINDGRITPLGRMLRKLKLDELPQLWNVLKGEMSFVGPRPDVPGFADMLCGDDLVLLSVRPGVTGPASLKYRNEEELLSSVDNPEHYNREVIWPDKVCINKDYIENWSLGNDISLIWRTMLG